MQNNIKTNDMKKFSTIEKIELIENVAIGDFFKRIGKDGRVMQKVYIKDQYDRFAKKYYGMDNDDICSGIHLKKGTKVLIGFDF